MKALNGNTLKAFLFPYHLNFPYTSSLTGSSHSLLLPGLDVAKCEEV